MNTAQPVQARRKQSTVLLLVLAAVCCVGLAGFVASLVYSYGGKSQADSLTGCQQLELPSAVRVSRTTVKRLAFCHDADGPYHSSNQYSGVWICGEAMLLAMQAGTVVLVPSSTSTAVRPRARWWA